MPSAQAAQRTAAHVFVDDLASPVLSGADAHHLTASLRLRDGEHVSVSDGIGGVRLCALRTTPTARSARHATAGGAYLEPLTDVETKAQESPTLTICAAMAKGDRPEWMVQKLTELGVDRIVPMVTDRTVVRLDGRSAGQRTERLRRVAREAAMQSRRVFLPEVAEITDFGSCVRGNPGAALAVPGGAPPEISRPCILVGPEGGWSDRELANDLPTIGLSIHLLRSETAAVAAAVLLGALRAVLVRCAEQ